MVDVLVAPGAWRTFATMTETHRLPPTAKMRVVARINALATFPERGRALDGRWTGFRYVLGPWPWMLIIYRVDAERSVVQVAAIQDARRAAAATSSG